MPSPLASGQTALDLFCGVGGLSLGLLQAGFRLLGGVDSDVIALRTYGVNFPEVRTTSNDLLECSGSQLRRDLGLGRSAIDLLAGGPPCQGFSAGGIRGKTDRRNQGVLAFARLVTELRPRYFLMENVRGFLFDDHASLRKCFCCTLEEAGYKVQPFRLLNAADFRVPQRRFRAFILGCRGSETPPCYPNPSGGLYTTVRDAIGDLAALDKHSRDYDSDLYDGPLNEASPYAASLRVSRSGGQLTSLTGCLRTRHSSDVVDRFKDTPPGGQEPVSRFFRLSWEGVSPTLRAGTGPDHGSHTAPRPIHPDLARCITVREAARLHSFPDWFTFHGTRWHGFRQIGNSVPPLLARAVAECVLLAAHSRRRKK
jgi:DNA (cytosine-5)-methyltransferase 1